MGKIKRRKKREVCKVCTLTKDRNTGYNLTQA